MNTHHSAADLRSLIFNRNESQALLRQHHRRRSSIRETGEPVNFLYSDVHVPISQQQRRNSSRGSIEPLSSHHSDFHVPISQQQRRNSNRVVTEPLWPHHSDSHLTVMQQRQHRNSINEVSFENFPALYEIIVLFC